MKKRGRRGFGGAWRAYVRMKTLGANGRPDLSKLKEGYAAVVSEDGAEIEQCRRIGELARLSAERTMPKLGQSAFGPKSRDVMRNRLKLSRAALTNSIEGLEKEQGALVLADRLVQMDANLPTCLSIARQALAAQGHRSAQHEREVDEKLREFDMGPGQCHRQHLQELVPAVKAEGLSALPCPGGLLFEVHGAREASVTRTVAWALASKESNCSGALRRYWQEIHRASGAQMQEDDTGLGALGVCFKEGRCLCSGEGKVLKRLRDAFLRAIKLAFPAKTDMRRLIVSGFVVVKLTGKPREGSDAWVEEDNPVKELYFHIGKLRLSPFRPTLLLLNRREGMKNDMGVPGTEHFEAAPVFYPICY